MSDPFEDLLPENCKAVDLTAAPADLLSQIHKKNPVLDLTQEFEPDFLVVDARKQDAEAINKWIRAYMEAEKSYPEFTPQISIIGQAKQDTVRLPDFDKDEYDDEARWDYISTTDLQTDVVKIYRDTVRHNLTELTKNDPTRGLTKIPDPSFKPVEEFITDPEELAAFRERVRRNQRGNKDSDDKTPPR